jgi:hypothetical protein
MRGGIRCRGSSIGDGAIAVLAETREIDPVARAALRARAQEVASDVAGTPFVPPQDGPQDIQRQAPPKRRQRAL